MLLPYLNKDLMEAGCDEAGRGCLAGAVYAAAVILPKDFKNALMNDSKQLTEKQRYALREVNEGNVLMSDSESIAISMQDQSAHSKKNRIILTFFLKVVAHIKIMHYFCTAFRKKIRNHCFSSSVG